MAHRTRSLHRIAGVLLCTLAVVGCQNPRLTQSSVPGTGSAKAPQGPQRITEQEFQQAQSSPKFKLLDVLTGYEPGTQAFDDELAKLQQEYPPPSPDYSMVWGVDADGSIHIGYFDGVWPHELPWKQSDGSWYCGYPFPAELEDCPGYVSVFGSNPPPSPLSLTSPQSAFSPNNDGVKDTDSLSITAGSSTKWTLSVDGQGIVTTGTGTPSAPYPWKGDANGKELPNGSYTLRLHADGAQDVTAKVTIDTAKPILKGNVTGIAQKLSNPDDPNSVYFEYTFTAGADDQGNLDAQSGVDPDSFVVEGGNATFGQAKSATKNSDGTYDFDAMLESQSTAPVLKCNLRVRDEAGNLSDPFPCQFAIRIKTASYMSQPDLPNYVALALKKFDSYHVAQVDIPHVPVPALDFTGRFKHAEQQVFYVKTDVNQEFDIKAKLSYETLVPDIYPFKHYLALVQIRNIADNTVFESRDLVLDFSSAHEVKIPFTWDGEYHETLAKNGYSLGDYAKTGLYAISSITDSVGASSDEEVEAQVPPPGVNDHRPHPFFQFKVSDHPIIKYSNLPTSQAGSPYYYGLQDQAHILDDHVFSPIGLHPMLRGPMKPPTAQNLSETGDSRDYFSYYDWKDGQDSATSMSVPRPKYDNGSYYNLDTESATSYLLTTALQDPTSPEYEPKADWVLTTVLKMGVAILKAPPSSVYHVDETSEAMPIQLPNGRVIWVAVVPAIRRGTQNSIVTVYPCWIYQEPYEDGID